MKVRPGRIKIVFSDPVPTEEYKYQDREKLSDMIRQRIEQNYDPHFNEKSA